MVKKFKLLGIDPGTSFSGYAVITVTLNKNKVERISWVRSGLFRNLVKTLDANTYSNSKVYMKEIRLLLNTYKPDVIVMESFTVRRFQTNLGAPISLMIGMVLHMAHRRGIKFLTIMPSDWKNRLKRDFDNIENLYDLSYPTKNRLPNHNLDSFFQALFACGELCYKNLKQSQIDSIKRKMKASISLLQDVDFVNNLEKERKILKKSKKRKKKK